MITPHEAIALTDISIAELTPARLPTAAQQMRLVTTRIPEARNALLWATDESVRDAALDRYAETLGMLEDDESTLVRAYLRTLGNASETAAQLGIHRHTLRSRVHAIEEVHGLDLSDPRTLAELYVLDTAYQAAR